MKQIQLVLFALFVCSIQIGRAAQPFATGSFTMLLYIDVNNFLYEYDVNGNKLQEIALPAGTTYGDGTRISLDTSGTLLAVPLNTYWNASVYTYNANGVNVDITTIGNSYSAQYGMVSGQDVWMGSVNGVAYTTRGTTNAKPLTANIIPGTGVATDPIQLYGTKLYYSEADGLMVMDPIVTSGTGNETRLLASQLKFYVHNDTLIYGWDNSILSRFSVANGAASTDYTASVPMGGIQSLTAVETGGVTYVLMCGVGAGTYVVKRFTDTGSEFTSETNIVDTLSFIPVSVAPSPVATCTDGFKDQDESDVDCGGTKCNKCDDGKVCTVSGDCTSGVCSVDGLCAVPACDDTVMNGNETDVDCGGDICSKCANDKGCKLNSDCESNFCDGNICSNPPVSVPVDAPASSSPTGSATPTKQKPASTGAVTEAFMLGALITAALTM